MTALRRILPFLKQEKTALILASIAMAMYAIATALYAYLSGPALKLIFTGESLELPSGLKPPNLSNSTPIGLPFSKPIPIGHYLYCLSVSLSSKALAKPVNSTSWERWPNRFSYDCEKIYLRDSSTTVQDSFIREDSATY